MGTETVIGTLVGAVLGFLTSLGIEYYFARQSGKELKAEVERLRQLITMLVVGMERQGLVSAQYDEKGMATGWKPITGSLNVTLEGVDSVSATGEVRDPEPKPKAAPNPPDSEPS